MPWSEAAELHIAVILNDKFKERRTLTCYPQPSCRLSLLAAAEPVCLLHAPCNLTFALSLMQLL
jgi:hypothetical protein